MPRSSYLYTCYRSRIGRWQTLASPLGVESRVSRASRASGNTTLTPPSSNVKRKWKHNLPPTLLTSARLDAIGRPFGCEAVHPCVTVLASPLGLGISNLRLFYVYLFVYTRSKDECEHTLSLLSPLPRPHGLQAHGICWRTSASRRNIKKRDERQKILL